MRNLYKRLGVSRNASTNDIRKAIKDCGDVRLSEDAAAVLCNEGRRAQYDRLHGTLLQIGSLRTRLTVKSGPSWEHDLARDFDAHGLAGYSMTDRLAAKLRRPKGGTTTGTSQTAAAFGLGQISGIFVRGIKAARAMIARVFRVAYALFGYAVLLLVGYALVQGLLSNGLKEQPATESRSSDGIPRRATRDSPERTPAPVAARPLDKADICELQSSLAALGLYVGPFDGIAGGGTNGGVQQLLASLGKPFDGALDTEILELSLAESKRKGNTAGLPLPGSGAVLRGNNHGESQLTLKTAAQGLHYYVKIVDAATNAPLKEFFVQSGQTAVIKIPLGRYEIRYATGQQWLGTTCLFGRETQFAKADKVFNFVRIPAKPITDSV